MFHSSKFRGTKKSKCSLQLTAKELFVFVAIYSHSKPNQSELQYTHPALVSFSWQGVPDSTEKQAIEVINYLIATEHENELARSVGYLYFIFVLMLVVCRQKPPTPLPQPSPEPQEVLRNAVIALPKIHWYADWFIGCHQIHLRYSPHSLVRLGETHRSCCHPERETTYSLSECKC